MHAPELDGGSARLHALLGQASWALSHAEAMLAENHEDEANADLERAAACEEQAASLLEASGRTLEAMIHFVSAASCHEQLGEFGRAGALLRSALSCGPPEHYRRDLELQLARCLLAVPAEVTVTPSLPPEPVIAAG